MDKEFIQKELTAGTGINLIAKKLSVSYQAVYQFIRKNQDLWEILRRRYTKERLLGITAPDIQRMCESEMSIQQMADSYGVSYQSFLHRVRGSKDLNAVFSKYYVNKVRGPKKQLTFTGADLIQFLKEGRNTFDGIGLKLNVSGRTVWRYVISDNELKRIWNDRFRVKKEY